MPETYNEKNRSPLPKLVMLLAVLWLWRCLRVAALSRLFVAMVFLLPLIGAGYLLSAVFVTRGLARLARQRRWYGFAGVLLGVALLFLPWTAWYEDARFFVLRPQMEAAAQRIVATTQIETDSASFSIAIDLPPGERYLSRYAGKAVYFPKHQVVMFYADVGLLDNYAGYLYFAGGPHATEHTAESLSAYYDGLIYYEDKGERWEYCAYS